MPPFGGMEDEEDFFPPPAPKPKKKKDKKKFGRGRRRNRLLGSLIDWWYAEPEEPDEEELEKQRREKARQEKLDAADAHQKELELIRNKEFFENDLITLTVTKPLDPYDELEITVHIIPRELNSDNIELQPPSFTYSCNEPDEVLGEGERVYEGFGTNMPERIFIMNNRDYNLGVANHADAWAVFFLFTFGIACCPLMMMRRGERSFHRMIQVGKEVAERQRLATLKRLESGQESTPEEDDDDDDDDDSD